MRTFRFHPLPSAVWGGLFLCAYLLLASGAFAAFVRVSPRDPHYFELSNGRPYIPNGLNMIAPNTSDAQGLARMERWMQALSTNGGNYARIWLSSPFWDVESQKTGVYDEEKAKRIDALLDMANRYGIRLKLTLEHFRTMEDPAPQPWAHRPLHLVSKGGTATNMADFFDGRASRDQFIRKLQWLGNRYSSQPSIYGWELWNEVNAVACDESHYLPWSEVMLQELHRVFPQNMAMQSLGSYDNDRVRDLYCRHSLMRGNDVAQVHRYLDLGAKLDVCHGPVDVLAADAVREILKCKPGRPVILAESGAVEPNHAGPFKLYAKDTEGIILHDILFAPFFAGAAGAGQCWHWDSYVDKNNLWHHFARFAAAVKGIDPVAEQFKPVIMNDPRFRIYALLGNQTILLWCRDSHSDWKTELEQGVAPAPIEAAQIDMKELLFRRKPMQAQTYDPWKDQWIQAKGDGRMMTLPSFTRSIVVRMTPAEATPRRP